MKPIFVILFYSSAIALCSTVSAQAPRFVCYFPNWAYYRPGDGKYGVDNINPSLCTHLIYAFATLNGSSYTIQPHDPYVDFDNKFYEKFFALKMQNPRLLTMIAIGGYDDSNDGSGKYSRLVSSADNIQNFVNSVTAFLREHKFDGLDLDWEYPSTSDKSGFANLLQSLQFAFKDSGYYLSVAVPTSVTKIDQGYDVGTMAETADFINLMSYDMHGSWNRTHADHHAPLYRRLWEEEGSMNNIDYSVDYWIKQGMPPTKINLGIPVYGRTWTLASVESVDHIPPAEAVSAGMPGTFTNEPGFLGYYEICNSIKNDGWELLRDPDGLNPYAVSPLVPKTWVGFDDTVSAGIKTDYIVTQNLGGAMVWDMSTDDFGNLCGGGKNPIMQTVKDRMGVGSANSKGRFVCYFPNWSGYRTGGGTFTVDDIDPFLCTDYVYAFTTLDNTTYEMKPFDPEIDINRKGYEKFVQMKAVNPDIKTWIAIGGWTDSHHGDKYSQLVSSQTNIDKFVESAYAFLKTYEFDGLDVDWEFPMTESDKSGFRELLISLHEVLNKSGHMISVAMSVNTMIIDSGYDIATLKEKTNFINLMAYDMHGAWEMKTDNHAPLYKRPWEEENNNNNIDYTVKHLLNQGLPADKLNLGIPLYGQSWTLKSYPTDIKPTLPAKASGGGGPGPLTNQFGFLGYNEICKYVKENNWSVTRDPEMLNGPYAFSPVPPYTWVGYDDPEMAAYKASYVLDKKLGGAMVWDMSTDDFKGSCSSSVNPILTAIAQALSGAIPTATTTSLVSSITPTWSTPAPNRSTSQRATFTRFITTTPEPATRIVRTTLSSNNASLPKSCLVVFFTVIGLFVFA